jgi:hypothetical protein
MSHEATPAERRLAAIGDLSVSLSGAAAALELGLAGAAAMDRDNMLPDHYSEGLEYMARHLSEVAEGVAALAQNRPPRWMIGMEFRDVPAFKVKS